MHVLQLRGGLLETRHPVRAVALRLDPEGAEEGAARAEEVFAAGEAVHSTWRSASKPFQLWSSLEAMAASGHSENTPFHEATFSDEDLALGASSHSGGADHTGRVLELLERFGLGPEHLRCGAELPLDPAALRALRRSGAPAEAVHNDCSGKHAFMLGACAAMGWSIEGYLAPEHPLQERILAQLRALTGEPLAVAVDGCGVPTAWLSVRAMARAWAWLAACMAEPDLDPRLARIGQAMAAHPELTSGEGRIDLALAELATEPYVGKIGAQGVFCVALPERGLGVALKVGSGDEAALACAVPAVLARVAPGALRDPGKAWPWRELRNVAGRLVGERLVMGLWD